MIEYCAESTEIASRSSEWENVLLATRVRSAPASMYTPENEASTEIPSMSTSVLFWPT